MGVIYSATHRDAGWDILVKEFYSGAIVDAVKRTLLRNMFKKEANIMLDFSCEFIPHILDYIEEGDSQYIVMTRILGQSLEQILENGPSDEKHVVRWGYDIFSAL